MSQYRTFDDLVQKTLDKLGVVAAGQQPSPEETAKIADNLPTIFAELAAREIVYVTDENSIPAAWFMPIASIAAYELREEFGIVGDEAAELEKAATVGEMRLKAILRGRPTYEPLKTLYL